MRRFGAFALVLGIAGFFYCSSQKERYGTVPADVSVEKAVHTAAGQWEIGQYASAAVAAMGGLMLMFPKGR